MINLDYKDGRTLHEQIEDGFRELIISGIMKTDEQLPSVRELSISLTVNPNTVQKAYKELETAGYIYSVKGKGNFVAPVSHNKDEKRVSELYEEITSAVKELMYLGETKEGIQNLVNNIYSEKEEA